MTKRIFIINGHPGTASISKDLTERYADAATRAGHQVRIAHLPDLRFDSDFGEGGYQATKPLEPALEQFLDDLHWSEHVVLAAPMWWGGLPAKLKGLFDRILLPGRTFSTRGKTWLGFPQPMLAGRTGRFILTSDTPGLYMHCLYGNALFRQVRSQIFSFVGISPTKITHLIGASHLKLKTLDRWFRRMERLGTLGA